MVDLVKLPWELKGFVKEHQLEEAKRSNILTPELALHTGTSSILTDVEQNQEMGEC